MARPTFLIVSALLVAMLGLSTPSGGVTTRPHSRPGPSLTTCREQAQTETLTAAKLTVATNDPALAPWFVNDSPSNHLGYESAFAYQVAAVLGFRARAVVWYSEPFELATAAGAKPFDFDVNEVTYARVLTNTVALSTSYYNVNQSLVALKTNDIVTHHTPTELHTYRFGAVGGSPGLRLSRNEIRPTRATIAYATLAYAVNALLAKRIDAIVIDTPTGQYLTSKQLPSAVQFAQLHTSSQYYVLVLKKRSPILACVDTAIKHLRLTGVLTSLSRKYLRVYNSIPFIAP